MLKQEKDFLAKTLYGQNIMNIYRKPHELKNKLWWILHALILPCMDSMDFWTFYTSAQTRKRFLAKTLHGQNIMNIKKVAIIQELTGHSTFFLLHNLCFYTYDNVI